MWCLFVNEGGKREGLAKDDSQALDILKRINSGIIHWGVGGRGGYKKSLEC